MSRPPLRPADVAPSTRLAAVLGWPITHSRSPVMLDAAFAATGLDARLVPVGVPPAELPAVVAELRALPMLGASVTMPHKLAVAALCDDLTPAARAIGAVNCLALEDGRLVGHNTDAAGFADGLAAAGYARPDGHVVLLGAGGAARAVAYGLAGAGAVEVIARRPDAVAWPRALPWTDAQLRASFARAALVVDCTSAGFAPDTDAAFVAGLPLEALAADAWVATLVYHRRTALLGRAHAAGHATLDGRPMLVHQGAHAFTRWTGLPAPVDVMAAALDASLAAAGT